MFRFFRGLCEQNGRIDNPKTTHSKGDSQGQEQRIDISTKLAILPSDIFDNACTLVREKSPEENRKKGKDFVDSANWERALPYCLANSLQIGDSTAISSVGLCCAKIVMSAARSGQINQREEELLCAAVAFLTLFLDADGSDVAPSLSPDLFSVPYMLRGNMFLIRGQIHKDKRALEQAEQDYQQALKIGCSHKSNMEIWRRSLRRVQHLLVDLSSRR